MSVYHRQMVQYIGPRNLDREVERRRGQGHHPGHIHNHHGCSTLCVKLCLLLTGAYCEWTEVAGDRRHATGTDRQRSEESLVLHVAQNRSYEEIYRPERERVDTHVHICLILLRCRSLRGSCDILRFLEAMEASACERDEQEDNPPLLRSGDHEGASQPPSVTGRATVAVSSKGRWTSEEDALLRQGEEEPQRCGLPPPSDSCTWTVMPPPGGKWTALVPGKTLSQCSSRCTRLHPAKGGWTAKVRCRTLFADDLANDTLTYL